MTLELSRELEEELREHAVQSGSNDLQAFVTGILSNYLAVHDWVPHNLEEVRAQIEEGCLEADRGELLSPEEVRRNMEEMKAQWHRDRSAA